MWKVLVVGLGQIGMGYDLDNLSFNSVRSHVRAISLHPDFKLVGAVDTEKTARDRFETTYKAKSFNCLNDALGEEKIDLAIIATPTHTHHHVLEQLLKVKSLSAVLCEKPLAWALSEAKQMVHMTDKMGVTLHMNYFRFAEPGTFEVGRRIREGLIKLPVTGVVNYSKGLLHNGSHFFTLVQDWLGEMLNFKILRKGANLPYGDANPDVRVNFSRGSIIFRSVQSNANSLNSIILAARNGRLEYQRGGRYITWLGSEEEDIDFARAKLLKDKVEVLITDFDRYQFHVLEQCASSLRGVGSNLYSGKDSLPSLGAIHSILETR